MTPEEFEITKDELDNLLALYPNIEKNAHVGKFSVRVVEMFFKSKYPNTTFLPGSKGADMEVCYDGKIERFEIKGTADDDIAWSKLKVSSQDCHDCLVAGMTLIRVTSIGQTKMRLYFLKHGEHFTLHTEVRFSVKPINRQKNNKSILK